MARPNQSCQTKRVLRRNATATTMWTFDAVDIASSAIAVKAFLGCIAQATVPLVTVAFCLCKKKLSTLFAFVGHSSHPPSITEKILALQLYLSTFAIIDRQPYYTRY